MLGRNTDLYIIVRALKFNNLATLLVILIIIFSLALRYENDISILVFHQLLHQDIIF